MIVTYIALSVGEAQMKKRSMAVQRDLPRPADMNSNIMRKVGPSDAPLSELQKVSVNNNCFGFIAQMVLLICDI